VFLATGSSPTYPIGEWTQLRVRQVGAQITVWADGELLTTTVDEDNPLTEGAFGLYTEDALVHFDDLEACSPM
jgi:hypothetical protein